MTQMPGLPRRDFLKALGVASMAGLLASCDNAGAEGGDGVGAGNFPETPDWNFVFINHVTTNPFFVPM
jgi:simple sugar transport system substrate-binding protein